VREIIFQQQRQFFLQLDYKLTEAFGAIFLVWQLQESGGSATWTEIGQLNLARSSHLIINVPRTLIPRC
jgi:hypothetical protein